MSERRYPPAPPDDEADEGDELEEWIDLGGEGKLAAASSRKE